MTFTFQTFAQKALGIPLLAIASVVIVIVTLLVYGTIIGIYNIYFHPLRNYPGPKLWAATHLRKHWANINGVMDLNIRSFHDKWGDVVRFSPDELSFRTAQAWRDIYAHGRKLQKDPLFYRSAADVDQTITMFQANDENHSRMRRRLAYAFSETALREQEPRLQAYTSTLMHRLKEIAKDGKKVDMVTWYIYTTFDIMGDLAFGLDDGFGCLKGSQYHPWVAITYKSLKGAPYNNMMNQFRIFWDLFAFFESKDLRYARQEHDRYSHRTVEQRLDKGVSSERKDFWSFMLSPKEEKDAMTREELIAHGNPLLMAGSESSSSVLSGITYLLLKNPDQLRKVTEEIRSTFRTEDAITFASTASKLPYTNAAINETMRIYPPVPTYLPRMSLPDKDTIIQGYPVPQNTRVGVHQLSANYAPANFAAPTTFAPQRWLDAGAAPASPYYADALDACQPFTIGPRACLGKNLAFAEMRLVLARVLWNFDLELCAESAKWIEQRSYVLWDKPPLMCRLRVREGA